MRASVVVLNFFGEEHLDACLGSLCAALDDETEVIVVDNGSPDRSAEVAARYRVRWLPLGCNLGFSKGNNAGARAARGDVLVFLNNDMRMAPDFVERILEPFADPAVFAVDALQFDWEGAHQIHGATRARRAGVLDALLHRTELPLLALEQTPDAEVVDVFQCCAGSMACHRERFLALGGFDERLSAGAEDTDICLRAALRGWRSVYTPAAVCWHKVSRSSDAGDGSWMRYRGSLGGGLLVATKLLPWPHVALAWTSALLSVVTHVRPSAWRRLLWKLRTLGEFARYVPGLLRERRAIFAAARSTPRDALRSWVAAP
jgi:GT2 family glycosyltransferase